VRRIVTFPLFLRQPLYRRLHQADACGALYLLQRIPALIAMAAGMGVFWKVRQRGETSQQFGAVRGLGHYRCACLRHDFFQHTSVVSPAMDFTEGDALHRAQGQCEGCGMAAPYMSPDGQPNSSIRPTFSPPEALASVKGPFAGLKAFSLKA